MRGSAVLYRCLWMCGVFSAMVFVDGRTLAASEGTHPSHSPRIIETDITSRPTSRSASLPLDTYLAALQARLIQETASITQTGLAEVRLTIRRDGVVEFAEVVPLDGPPTLRAQLLPIITGLGPLPPPPIEADKLIVSLMVPLQYPAGDLLDSFELIP